MTDDRDIIDLTPAPGPPPPDRWYWFTLGLFFGLVGVWALILLAHHPAPRPVPAGAVVQPGR